MERVAAGIVRDWEAQGRISAYTLTDISVGSLVPLSEHIAGALTERCAVDTRMGLLLDISAPGVGMRFLALTGQNIYNIGFTPMGQQRVTALLQTYPDFRVYVAVIVSSSLSGKITSARTRQTDAPETIVPQLFQERDAGLEWLTRVISG